MHGLCGERLWRRSGHGDQYTTQTGRSLRGSGTKRSARLYGTEPAVLARQRQRYAAALEQFELYYGPGRQVHVYSAPGRAELGGNHTDHQHGYGLAAAVTLDLVAVASPVTTVLSGSNPEVSTSWMSLT